MEKVITEITVRLNSEGVESKSAEYWLHQVLQDLGNSIVWDRDSIVDGYRVEKNNAVITVLVVEEDE
jgi:hypothetical protein